VQGALRIPQSKQILGRVGNAVLDHHVHLDDVLVAGQHQGFLVDGHLALKAHFDAAHLLDVDDVHRLGKREGVVQPGPRSAMFAAKATHDALLTRPDAVNTRDHEP
jgi:hypothetical protein